MKFNIKIIAINQKFSEIDYEYPITDKEYKDIIIDKFNITFDSLLPKTEFKELKVRYSFAERRLSTKVKKIDNFLPYSIKEINLDYDDIIFIMNLIHEEEIIKIDTEKLIWKLCITKTIKDEFLL